MSEQPRLLPVTPEEMAAAIETVDAGINEVEAAKAKYKTARKDAIEKLDERKDLDDAMQRLRDAREHVRELCAAYASQAQTGKAVRS